MDKYVAQLQQDTGATPENIVEAAGGIGFLKLSFDPVTLAINHTWNEIHAAILNGWFVSINQIMAGEGAETITVSQITLTQTYPKYAIGYIADGTPTALASCDDADDYPVIIT